MGFLKSMVPLGFVPGCRTSEVSVVARVTRFLFGAPNARRANGIVSAKFDVVGAAKRAVQKLTGKVRSVPIYAIDRIGTEYRESLPRIWLSESVSNTRRDAGRVFVESYPSAPDPGGALALELGDRYFGEGMAKSPHLSDSERVECFKAAEILYLHSARRGNRHAASRLRRIYSQDLCDGEYWRPMIEERAKHAKRRNMRRVAA